MLLNQTKCITLVYEFLSVIIFCYVILKRMNRFIWKRLINLVSISVPLHCRVCKYSSHGQKGMMEYSFGEASEEEML